ncbi:RtcB family protein [Halocatena halophila]|uniref:RtcB family protein n=1 Tax=Halocatena halophila TaxID=2814576 RepID=UPI002ED12F96
MDIDIELSPEYYNNLLDRVGYDEKRANQSLGTLGGGNHFIEVAQSETTGDYWLVVHSGSRGLGLSIAQYWQNRATDIMDEKAAVEIDYEAIRENFDGEDIKHEINRRKVEGPDQDRNTDLDYLEGEEMDGYLADMVFAQWYAMKNRKMILDSISTELDTFEEGVIGKSIISSTHNYIDFDDMVIRKGAIQAHENQKAVIPFNMRDGTLLVEGKGNPDWNNSAPHGAGRIMSRTRAFNELSAGEFAREMDGIFSTSVGKETLDESPMAYKSTEVIEEAIEPTATIVDRLKPVLNCKAE